MIRFILKPSSRSTSAWLALSVVLLSPGAAAPGSEGPLKGIAISNRTEQGVRYRLSYADDDRARSRDVTLDPGKTHSYNEARPLLCKFQSQTKTMQYVLSPGRRYAFSADDAGNLNLSRTAAAGDGATADVRELKVLVVADASYQRCFPNWSKRVRSLISEVSNHFDDNFGIRLSVWACKPWHRSVPANSGLNATTPLSQLLAVKPGEADLVIGFTILALPTSAQTVELGATTNFSQHVVIHESTQPQIAARAKGIVLHELCHVFGAFHLADPRSVMQPNIATAPRNVTVDEVTRQLIRLTRNFDLRKGVESLDDETIRKISDLYQRHHHPRSVDEDPIVGGYSYQALMAFDAGDTGRAKNMAHEVIGRTPRNFAAHMLLGAIALQDSNAKEATSAYFVATHLNPKSPEAHVGLGFAKLLQADARGALTEANVALRIDPKSQVARALREASWAEARNKEALEFLQKRTDARAVRSVPPVQQPDTNDPTHANAESPSGTHGNEIVLKNAGWAAYEVRVGGRGRWSAPQLAPHINIDHAFILDMERDEAPYLEIRFRQGRFAALRWKVHTLWPGKTYYFANRERKVELWEEMPGNRNNERGHSEPRSAEFWVASQRLPLRTAPSARATIIANVDEGAKIRGVELSGEWVRIDAIDEMGRWAELGATTAAWAFGPGLVTSEEELRNRQRDGTLFRTMTSQCCRVAKTGAIAVGSDLIFGATIIILPDEIKDIFAVEVPEYLICQPGHGAYLKDGRGMLMLFPRPLVPLGGRGDIFIKTKDDIAWSKVGRWPPDDLGLPDRRSIVDQPQSALPSAPAAAAARDAREMAVDAPTDDASRGVSRFSPWGGLTWYYDERTESEKTAARIKSMRAHDSPWQIPLGLLGAVDQ